jgi:type VI secretion system protein ImpA
LTELPALSEADKINKINHQANRDAGQHSLATREAILKSVDVTSIGSDRVAQTLLAHSTDLLRDRGKDLRVLPHLGAAAIVMNGLSGYGEVLRLALALMQAFPAELHPQPDKEDPDQQWQRASAIGKLVASDGVFALLDMAVVIESRKSAPLTLADLVGGQHPDIALPELETADLKAAVTQIGEPSATKLVETLRELSHTMVTIVDLLGSSTLSAPRLVETLKRAAARVEGVFHPAQAGSEATSSGPAAQGLAVPAVAMGSLRSRVDALRAIDDLVRFIESIEPGHPAPLLLRRAHRLLGMGFVDIIKDMAPGALGQIELIVGAKPAE